MLRRFMKLKLDKDSDTPTLSKSSQNSSVLCNDCLRIPLAFEPVRTGEISRHQPWLLEMPPWIDLDNLSPHEILALAARGSMLADNSIPKADFLVPRDLELQLKSTVHELESSALRGCEGCHFWLRRIPESLRSAREGSIGLKALPDELMRTVSVGSLNKFQLFLSSSPKKPTSSHNDSKRTSPKNQETRDDEPREETTSSNLCQFEVGVSDDNPAAQDRRVFTRQLSTTFEGKMSHLKAWLRLCTSSHDCQQKQVPFVPARLLNLGSHRAGEILRLHLTGKRFKDKYIALSYCWGEATQLMLTTSKNIGSYTKEIKLGSMPTVFQDAVMVARALDIRYIWIDALCIIQDSPEDWASESAKMGSIYQNAFLTVVASVSDAVNTSFLTYQEPVEALRLPFRSPRMKRPGQIFVQEIPTSGRSQDSSREHWAQPIHKRAWTLQERFLSTRTVFFDQSQMLFECVAGRRFENSTLEAELEGRDYPSQLATGRRGNDNFAGNLSKSRLSSAWTREIVHNPHPLLHADKYAQVEFNEHWNRVLIDFGLRSLTYSSDTLVALSAIAKEFAKELQDAYMAGIWLKDFRKGLLWNMRWYQIETKLRVSPRMASILADLPEHQRQAAASGPSWSWASRFTDPDKINFSVVASQKPLHDDYDAQLLEYFAIPVFPDAFGPLKIGMLTLKGYMARMSCTFGFTSPSEDGFPAGEGVLFLRSSPVLVDGSTAVLTDCFDCIPEMIPLGSEPEAGQMRGPVELQALVIAGFSVNRLKSQYSSGLRPIYYGLLLQPTEFVYENGDLVYRRVGIFSLDTEIVRETFKNPIGLDVYQATPETWTGWTLRDVAIV